MKTTEILKSETPNRCLEHLVALKPVKQLLALFVGAFVALCATLSAYAAPLESNAFTLVPERITYAPYFLEVARQAVQIVDAEITPSERQLLNAQVFSNLPESERPLYLYFVSHYASFKIASGGQSLNETALAVNLLQRLAIFDEIEDFEADLASPQTQRILVDGPYSVLSASVQTERNVNSSITRPFADGVSSSLNTGTLNYFLEVALRPASESHQTGGFVGTTDTNALEIVASSSLQTGKILNGLFTTTLDFGPGLRIQVSLSPKTEGFGGLPGRLNLNDIAAIGTRAETYVKGLCALIADQIVANPTNEEAIFVGLLSGAVTGLSNL